MRVEPEIGYSPPTEKDVKRGAQYVIQVSLASSDCPGTVFAGADAGDEPRWQFKTEPPRHAWSPVNLVLGKPAFVLLDCDAREILRIRRRKRIPPSFEILENAAVVGEVRRLGVVSYRIHLVGGPTWIFRMTPFTQLFFAVSNGRIGAWVQVWRSEMCWVVLVRSEADGLRLLAALAFIHRERCLYM